MYLSANRFSIGKENEFKCIRVFRLGFSGLAEIRTYLPRYLGTLWIGLNIKVTLFLTQSHSRYFFVTNCILKSFIHATIIHWEKSVWSLRDLYQIPKTLLVTSNFPMCSSWAHIQIQKLVLRRVHYQGFPHWKTPRLVHSSLFSFLAALGTKMLQTTPVWMGRLNFMPSKEPFIMYKNEINLSAADVFNDFRFFNTVSI